VNGHLQLLQSPTALSATGVQTVILAAELTHLAEEGGQRPKALVEIGGRPLLWHLLSRLGEYGLNDFVVALGALGELVKRSVMDSDWRIDFIDTGLEASAGERLLRLRSQPDGGPLLLAPLDCLCDLDLEALLAFHRAGGRLATLAVARPQARFGRLDLRGDQVINFAEKPQREEGWVSAGFCVLEPGAFDYLLPDDTDWEHEPLEWLAADGQLAAFKHDGFWQRMETLRDKQLLEGLWQSGSAPWKTWD
jgi:glucose-1-phosphate cytidylyltransferase